MPATEHHDVCAAAEGVQVPAAPVRVLQGQLRSPRALVRERKGFQGLVSPSVSGSWCLFLGTPVCPVRPAPETEAASQYLGATRSQGCGDPPSGQSGLLTFTPNFVNSHGRSTPHQHTSPGSTVWTRCWSRGPVVCSPATGPQGTTSKPSGNHMQSETLIPEVRQWLDRFGVKCPTWAWEGNRTWWSAAGLGSPFSSPSPRTPDHAARPPRQAVFPPERCERNATCFQPDPCEPQMGKPLTFPLPR